MFKLGNRLVFILDFFRHHFRQLTVGDVTVFFRLNNQRAKLLETQFARAILINLFQGLFQSLFFAAVIARLRHGTQYRRFYFKRLIKKNIDSGLRRAGGIDLKRFAFCRFFLTGSHTNTLFLCLRTSSDRKKELRESSLHFSDFHRGSECSHSLIVFQQLNCKRWLIIGGAKAFLL